MTSDTTMTPERLVEIRGIAERARNANTCRLSLSAFSPHATGAVVVLQPEEVISLADDLIATRAELAELRRVVAEAIAAMRQCNWSVSGLPGCITDALNRVPLTYEDERSAGERETYTAIRALVATASTEQEGA